MQNVTPWYITLLGGLRITRDGRTIERFRSHKIGSFLAYLALFPNRAHTREELANLFWPDAEEEGGRANLRTALAALRREVEAGDGDECLSLLGRGGGDVRLIPGSFTTDVAAFERAVAQARHSATPAPEQARLLTVAANLHQGPLLPGVYEPWALGERDRLAEMYQTTLSRLTRHHERTGEWTEALTWARRAVAADPLSEAAHAEIIRLLMASGQTAAARRHFDESERLLATKLGTEASPEMRAALQTPRALSNPSLSATTSEVPHRGLSIPDTQPALSEPSVPVPYDPLPTSLLPTPKMPEATVRLPLTMTPFFGREIETAQISTLLRGGNARLVTLTGTGGAGKTRLAVEVARHSAPHFAGGVWWVPLADLRDPTRLLDVIAGALELPRSPEIRPLDQIALAFGNGIGPLLLVLDNFEHLVDEGAPLIHELLARVPDLLCLVTSRRRLLLDGEQEFAVSPLPTPNHPGTTKHLGEFASVQLFVSRARAARPDFQLTDRNAASVATLCARLEGLPLAIELAAAWANTLTPAQMAERLNPQSGGARRFDLLVSRRRDAPDRHATLRAAIEWSWSLLPPELGKFFAALSQFRGGWTLEAAETVTGEIRALEFLAELCERSLIIAEEDTQKSGAEGDEDTANSDGGTGMRFRMLESLREFAKEQLARDEPAQAGLAARHLTYFLLMAEEAEPHLTGPEQIAYLHWLEQDHDNFRAALQAAFTDEQDNVTALRLATALISFWIRHGHLRDGLAYLQRALEREATTPEAVKARMNALPGTGWLAWCLHDRDGRVRAAAYSEEGLALCREGGDLWGVSLCLTTLGLVAQQSNDLERARALAEESVAVARAEGQARMTGHSLRTLGSIILRQGDAEQARAVMSDGVAALRRSGDRYGIAGALRELAVVLAELNDRATARQYIDESISLYSQLGDMGMVGLATLVLGNITRDDGDGERACEHFDTTLRLCREAGNQYGMAHTLHNRADAHLAQHKYAEAQTDFLDSLLLFRDLGNQTDIVLSLEGLSFLAGAQQDAKRAVRLLGAADSLRRSLGAPLSANDLLRRDALLRVARAALGEATFDEVWAGGAALTFEQAVTYALKIAPHPYSAAAALQ